MSKAHFVFPISLPEDHDRPSDAQPAVCHPQRPSSLLRELFLRRLT